MQTFLPYPDFAESAKVLDRQRLGKQRVETLQILKALTDGGTWASHPAVAMWNGYSQALIAYGLAICDEWIARGYKDTCRDKIAAYTSRFPMTLLMPPWLGNAPFHLAHRSRLANKMPEHYLPIFGSAAEYNLDYLWPVCPAHRTGTGFVTVQTLVQPSSVCFICGYTIIAHPECQSMTGTRILCRTISDRRIPHAVIERS